MAGKDRDEEYLRRSDLPSAAIVAGPQGLIAVVVVIAALYFGRDIFVPLALAVLLAFVLSPFISMLRRLHVPRTPAVIMIVCAACLGIVTFGFLVAGQVTQLGNSLPLYQSNIQQKIRALRENSTGKGIFEHASEMLQNLSEEIDGTRVVPAGRNGQPTIEAVPGETVIPPIPVEIRQPDPAPLELLQSVLGPLIEPLATGGIVIVFVIFMLLQREDLRDRFIRLAGAGDLNRTTQALGDAGRRVAKYLVMQLIVNATYGIPIGIGLWIIGVPNPLLWGMLAMVMRFVPYVGPVIAAIIPLALSIAVDPGWTMLLWTAALFITLELLSNNVVEPWLYGASTGLSPVAIIVAAIFWTWLWGPIGLLLSTPLTVCLVVLGQHVPQLGFLDVLLGSEPVLTPQQSLYQRLLAGDPDEATERAEGYVEAHSLLAYYDDVAIPALKMTEDDRARGTLDETRRAAIVRGAFALVDNFSDFEPDRHRDVEDNEDVTIGEDALAPQLLRLPEGREPAPAWRGTPVLCGGARGNIDDAAAAMLAQMLGRGGIGARTVPFEALDSAHYADLDLDGVQVICLSFMNSESIAHARFLVRRLRRLTDVPILVGFWSMSREEADAKNLIAATRAEMSATSLAEALEQIFAIVQTVETTPTAPAIEPVAGLSPVPALPGIGAAIPAS